MIKGANIAGGNSRFGRVQYDYYATPPEAVEKLLKQRTFDGVKVLEPCVGGGHIMGALKQAMPQADFTALDIVDRGYPGTIKADFLTWEGPADYDTIITNPPYMLASEFIEKCHEHLKDGGQLAMFLKIQFLEGMKRESLFTQYPPRPSTCSERGYPHGTTAARLTRTRGSRGRRPLHSAGTSGGRDGRGNR